MSKNIPRLPLAALIRNENSGIIYLVIKVEELEGSYVYYLCCVYNPAQIDQTFPFEYHHIVGDDKSYKYTVLNTTIKTKRDGSLYHIISNIDYDEIVNFKNNKDFILRYFSACSYFKKNKSVYSITAVNKEDNTVDIRRKSTMLEYLMFRPVYLTFRVSWVSLLGDYIPYLPDNLDEIDFMKTVQANRYF